MVAHRCVYRCVPPPLPPPPRGRHPCHFLQEDIEYTNKLYGYRFGQYIKTVGWDQGDCWFAHCCMLNDEEQDFFAANKIGIAHCPSSNTRLASGIAPIRCVPACMHACMPACRTGGRGSRRVGGGVPVHKALLLAMSWP